MSNENEIKEPMTKKKKIIIGASVAAAVVAVIAVVIAILMNTRIFSGENGKIIDQNGVGEVVASTSVEGDDPDGKIPLEEKEDDTIRSENFLIIGLDESGQLADVIMLACFDYEKMSVNVLQIPRDTYIANGSSPTKKINGEYSLGNQELTPVNRIISVINDQYALKVDHYATITTESFRNCIDAIGGVPINLPYQIGNEELGILPAGEQILDGQQSEWLVRHRYTYYEGDIGRMKMQRLFLASLFSRIKTIGTEEILNLVPVLFGEFTTDITVSQALGYVKLAMNVDLENVTMFILPGEGVMYEKQAVWGVHLNESADMLNEYFRPYSDDVPAEKLGIVEIVHTGSYYENTQDDMESLVSGDKIGQKNDSDLPVYTHIVTQPAPETTPPDPALAGTSFYFDDETGEWVSSFDESVTDGPHYYKYDEESHGWVEVEPPEDETGEKTLVSSDTLTGDDIPPEEPEESTTVAETTETTKESEESE